MKGISKKLLGVLAAICLLASIALPAGVLSNAANANDPVVTEIDFSTGNAWVDAVYRESTMSAENPYIVSFDYYLASDAVVKFNSVAGWEGTLEGSSNATLKLGHHQFVGKYATTAGNNTFAPRLSCSDVSAKLYIWNYSITLNGTPITAKEPLDGAATATTEKHLSQYPWSAYMDEPIVTEVTFIDDGKNDGASNYSPKTCWYYGGTSAENAYTISFDYYLPETLGGIRFYSVSGGMTTVSGGSMDRSAGIHHFEWVTYNTSNNGQLVTAIESVYGAKMFIWNWSVKINGKEIAGQAKGDWNGQTNGVVGKHLVQYDWYKYESSPVVTEIDFANGDTWVDAVYKEPTMSATNPYIVTFEYYLDSNATVKFGSVAGNIGTQAGSSSSTLERGYHKFVGKYAVSAGGNTIAPQLVNTAKDAKLYIWNYSITLNGAAISQNSPYDSSATATSTKRLVEYDWAATMESPFVTEYDFSTGNSWCLGFFTGKTATAEVPYILSFDYYLPEDSGAVSFESIGNHASITKGSIKFEAGHHKVYTEWKTNNSNNYFVPRIKCSDTNTKLYIWNYSLTIGGLEGKNNGQKESSWMTATVSNEKQLYEYAWSKTMDMPYVTEITFPGTGTSNWSPKPAWYFGGTSEENAYTVSFDYYIPEELGGIRFFSVSGGMTTVSGGTMDRSAGIHHFEWVGYRSSNDGQLVTAIEATGGDQIYLWNWSVKINGQEVAPTDKSAEWNGKTNGTLGKQLHEYDWSGIDLGEDEEEEETIEPVGINATVINFTSTNTKWRDGGVYRNSAQSVATPYTLSFDYYLPYGETVKFSSVAGSITSQAGSTSLKLKPGYHTFVANMTTTAGNNTYAPELICSSGDATLYIWNYSGVKLNGEPLTKSESIASAITAVEGGDLTTYDWYAHKDHAFVTEIDFAGASAETKKTWYDAPGLYFGGVDEATAYTVTFDYYVPAAVNSLKFGSVSSGMTTVSGSNVMDGSVGIHSFSWTTYSSVGTGNKAGQFAPTITSDTDVVLYVWNYKVEKDGKELDSTTSVNGSLTSPITPTGGKELCQYDWSGLGDSETPAPPVVTEPGVAFVDATNGDDATAMIGVTEKPYKTINAAITALDALTGDVDRIVKVVGAYSCTNAGEAFASNQWKGFATHTNLITIQSADPTNESVSVDMTGVCWLGGPIKLDKIRCYFASNTSELRLNGADLTLGKDAVILSGTGSVLAHKPYLFAGAYAPGAQNNARPTAKQTIVYDGGEFSRVVLGDSSPRNNKAWDYPGIDFVMNGGSIDSLRIGGYASAYGGYNNFTDHVNVTINGGTIGTDIRTYDVITLNTGVKVQIILNNGNNLTVPTSMKDASGAEALYVIKVAANNNGSNLSATATPGVYKVNRIGDFEPIVKDKSGNPVANAYDANAKTITLPAAGQYSVIWEEVEIDPIVTEIVFPADGDKATVKWSPEKNFYFGGDSEENMYEVSFEYFLYDEVGSLNFDSVSGNMNTVEGSRKMETTAGYHKVYWKTWTAVKQSDTMTGQFVPFIEGPVGAKMYIWNWSVKINGEEVAPVKHGWNSQQTTGTVGQPLSTYDWFDGMENWHGDPTNPLVTAVDLAAGNKWYVGEFRDSAGSLDQYVWELEFEYFLPERIEVSFTNSPGWTSILEGTPKLEVGHHTFKIKQQVTKYEKIQKVDPATGEPMVDPETGEPVYETRGAIANAYIPTFSNSGGHGSTLYVWNLKVTLNGQEYKLNEFNATSSNPQAPRDMSKKLKEYDWHTYMDTVVDTTPPDVVAIDFTQGERWTHTIVRANTYSAENPYVVTFDYYLPVEHANVPFVLDSVAGGHRLLGGDAPYFVTGHHTFHAIYSCSAAGNTFAPYLLDKSMTAKLYVWNFKIYTGNEEVLYSTAGEVQNYTSAGIDKSKRLNEFDWYEGMDEVPVVKHETQESQFMLKIDNYYFDVETSQTLKDQEFRQLVGLANCNQTGTIIKPNTTYVFSFDYYSEMNLSSDLRVWQMFTGDGRELTGGSGRSFLDAITHEGVGVELEYEGRYHVESEFTTWPNQYDLSVGIGTGVDGTGYYWNFSLKEKGSDEELLRNTALIRPKPIAETGKTVGDWITNDVDKEFAGNFTWIPMDSAEAKEILALKEGETLEREEEEEEEEEEEDKKPAKDNPLGEGTLYDEDFDIALDYADASGIGPQYSLDVYVWPEEELSPAILALIGERSYMAYDIRLVLYNEWITPEKDIFMALPIPEGYDPESTHVYFCDEFGRLIDTQAYVEGDYMMVEYSVLGTFILVDGDVLDSGSSEVEPDTDVDVTPDEDDKDDKKDKKSKKSKKDDSNGWILWVAIIGGAVLLAAAAAVVTLTVLKKKKGAKAE